MNHTKQNSKAIEFGFQWFADNLAQSSQLMIILMFSTLIDSIQFGVNLIFHHKESYFIIPDLNDFQLAQLILVYQHFKDYKIYHRLPSNKL